MSKKKRHQNRGLRKFCDCPRRSWSTCRHSWQFNFKPRGGDLVRCSLDKEFGRPITSKTEAEKLADELRTQIRAGTFRRPAPATADLTLEQLCKRFTSDIENPKTAENYASPLRVVCATLVPPLPEAKPVRLGDFRVVDIKRDIVKAFRRVRLAVGVAAANRSTSALRATLNWAELNEIIERAPNLKRLNTKEASRRRRLQEGEGEALLAACGPHLRAVVECALETGMRRGEVLSLQWWQVAWTKKPEILLPASKTKTRTDRAIPISTRLRAILEMRRCDPKGDPMPDDAYVFGTEIGTRILGVGRAWHAAVLRSHGIKPTYTAQTANLDAVSRAALKKIDLHFHDLRREAASRWLDGGWQLHSVQHALGHANITQTSTYLGVTERQLHDELAKYETRNAMATDAGSTGQGRPRTAARPIRKPRKSREGHGPALH